VSGKAFAAGFARVCYLNGSIFILIKKKIILSGIIGPDVLNTFEQFALIFHFLQILDDLQGSS
jgi:hypothetical protein